MGIRIMVSLKKITAEPVKFLIMFGVRCSEVIIQNFFIDYICRNECSLSESVCSTLSSHIQEEEKVEKLMQKYYVVYRSIAQSIIPAIIVIIIGPLSDMYGRTPPLIFSLLMNCLCYVTYMVISFFPKANILWLLLPSLPIAISGGWYTINLICCALVSDSSDKNSRSTRISFLQFAQALGICAGYLVGDVVFKYYGYRMVFAISIASHILTILYAWVRFPWDIRKCTDVDASVFTPMKRLYRLLRCSQEKLSIVLLCFAMVVCQFTKKADASVAYLYTRHQYSWGPGEYSVYVMLVVLCGAVGTSLIYPTLSLHLKVDDCVLGIMGSISWINYHLVTGLAFNSWIMYFAAVLGVLGISTNVTVRSMLSKTADAKSSGGALFSLLASIEALIPLVSSPIIAWIYTTTLNMFPGTIFLVTAAIFGLNVLIFFVLFLRKK